MDQNKAEDNDLLFKVECQNRERLYSEVQKARGDKDIEEYREAVRELYFNEGLFQNKKSREMLERALQ